MMVRIVQAADKPYVPAKGMPDEAETVRMGVAPPRPTLAGILAAKSTAARAAPTSQLAAILGDSLPAAGAAPVAAPPAPGPAPVAMPAPAPAGGMLSAAVSDAFGGTPTAIDTSGLPALGQQIANAKTNGPGFFDGGGAGERILHAIGEASLPLRAGFGDPFAIHTLAGRRERKLATREAAALAREAAKRAEDRRWAVEDRDARANQPQYFSSGTDRVRFDPATGQSSVVYDGPADYEAYAGSLGLAPGDDGYDDAVQDYVLRGNGPTSQAARQALEAARSAERLRLRAMPTYAQGHPRSSGGRAGSGGAPRSPSAVAAPILQKVARGGQLTPGEERVLSYVGGGRGGRGGGNLPVVRTPAEAAKLPSGTRFKTPDGRTKVAP